MIAETSFSSQKFQDFVLTGAERWLEVIQDWTTYGKVIHFILVVLMCIFSSFEKPSSNQNFLSISIFDWTSFEELRDAFQDLHFIFYERLCDDPVSEHKNLNVSNYFLMFFVSTV